jgi:hemerythrin-like domain-containing protein
MSPGSPGSGSTAPNGTTSVEAVFFDARDTLGEVDRPGHLVPYRPSTERLLAAMRDLVGVRIGVITNLPRDVSADQGRQMILDAVLSETSANGSEARTVRIGDFVDRDAIVINHEAGFDKPDPRIYRFAAGKLGVPVERSLYCGENLIEVLGARAAGMQAELKASPPGSDFAPEPIKGLTPTDTFSGRAFEMVLEHEHLLGDRIFGCIHRIVAWARSLAPGDPLPADLRAAMGIMAYLTANFVDAFHLKAEEAVVPLAVARGMDPAAATFMWDHHDQARAYFGCVAVAWRRLERDDDRDRALAVDAYVRSVEGLVTLFEPHAVRENDELFPTVGRYLNDTDDTLIVNIVRQAGGGDVTPYVALVGAMESALAGAPEPAPAPPPPPPAPAPAEV